LLDYAFTNRLGALQMTFPITGDFADDIVKEILKALRPRE